MPFSAPSPAGWPDEGSKWVSARRCCSARVRHGGRPAHRRRWQPTLLDQSILPVASDATRLAVQRAPVAGQALATLFACRIPEEIAMITRPMINRRGVLTGIGAGALPAFVLPGLSVAFAAPPTGRRLIVVVLRGALDGLAAVPPFADPDYRTLRARSPSPSRGRATARLDGRFGLRPALKLTVARDVSAEGDARLPCRGDALSQPLALRRSGPAGEWCGVGACCLRRLAQPGAGAVRRRR
jgi:hypothetical protein